MTKKKRTTKANGSSNGHRNRLPILDSGRRQVPCLSCGTCCTYVAVEIDGPTTARRASEMLWYLYHDKIGVYFDGEEWHVQFETRCQHLQDDLKCAIYERRPQICRDYDERECEVNAPDEGMFFATPGEFIDFLKRRRKRVYAELEKRFLPAPSTWDGKLKGSRRMAPYRNRFRRLRDLGAP